jgi:hypothetical protein
VIDNVSLDLVQVVVQGGAVGILLAFGWFAYKLANRVLSAGVGIIGNHLAHVEGALLKVERTLERLDRTIDRIVKGE